MPKTLTVPVNIDLTTSGTAPAAATKPGYLTTEFWTTSFLHLISFLAVVWTLLGRSGDLSPTLAPLVPVAALVASAVAQAVYSLCRGQVKVGAVTAAAALASSMTTIINHQPSTSGVSTTRLVDTPLSSPDVVKFT